METTTKPKIIVEAIITRADGSQENLGILSTKKEKNIFKNFLRRIIK